MQILAASALVQSTPSRVHRWEAGAAGVGLMVHIAPAEARARAVPRKEAGDVVVARQNGLSNDSMGCQTVPCGLTEFVGIGSRAIHQ